MNFRCVSVEEFSVEETLKSDRKSRSCTLEFSVEGVEFEPYKMAPKKPTGLSVDRLLQRRGDEKLRALSTPSLLRQRESRNSMEQT
jgi:hypothetical protein